jgi:hypothetical protein
MNDDFLYLSENHQLKEIQNNKKFNMKPFNIVVVLGVGGIGSNIVDLIASSSMCDQMIIIDDDVVDITNIARTPYHYDHIGFKKVEALAHHMATKVGFEFIVPIDGKLTVNNFDTLFNVDENDSNKKYKYKYSFRRSIFFDCRDDDYRDHNDLLEKFKHFFKREMYVVRPAYNELDMTLDLNPQEHPVWGQAGYHEVISSPLTSRLVALHAIMLACLIGDDGHTRIIKNEHIIKTDYLKFILVKHMENNAINVNIFDSLFGICLMDMIMEDKSLRNKIIYHLLESNTIPLTPEREKKSYGLDGFGQQHEGDEEDEEY